VRKLVEQGILRAVSVGFLTLDKELLKDGKGNRYKAAELVECSLVAVPANANALAIAKRLNIAAVQQAAIFERRR
jgi:phage head maturation protease